eukprot:9616233-Karenia_brevis.AAC.1
MVLKQTLPDEQFFINKSRGTISHSWKEFVQVTVEGPQSPHTLLWRPLKTTELGIDRDQVARSLLAKLERATSETDLDPWCL